MFNAGDPGHVDQVREITRGGVDFAFDLAGTINYEIVARLGARVPRVPAS